MKKDFFRVFNILIMMGFVGSCGHSRGLAPVSDVDQPPTRTLSHHIVTKGETLYSIAWRYNLDFRSLAKVNGIGPAYSIYPGQKLVLNTVAPKSPWKRPESSTPVKRKVSTAKHSTSTAPPSASVKPRSKKKSTSETKQTYRSVSTPSLKWGWPSGGKLVSKFNPKEGLHKGIDLKGNLGEPVLAAADGKVVYAGIGLRGYGKLLIVKHSEKFLSAYAHNSRLLVAEGAKVSKGQQIAEMGSSDADTVKLHFEIRYDGNPVDPLHYLPKK